jgi:hypothetical protein
MSIDISDKLECLKTLNTDWNADFFKSNSNTVKKVNTFIFNNLHSIKGDDFSPIFANLTTYNEVSGGQFQSSIEILSEQMQINNFQDELCTLQKVHGEKLISKALVLLKAQSYLSISQSGFEYLPKEHLRQFERACNHVKNRDFRREKWIENYGKDVVNGVLKQEKISSFQDLYKCSKDEILQLESKMGAAYELKNGSPLRTSCSSNLPEQKSSVVAIKTEKVAQGKLPESKKSDVFDIWKAKEAENTPKTLSPTNKSQPKLISTIKKQTAESALAEIQNAVQKLDGGDHKTLCRQINELKQFIKQKVEKFPELEVQLGNLNVALDALSNSKAFMPGTAEARMLNENSKKETITVKGEKALCNFQCYDQNKNLHASTARSNLLKNLKKTPLAQLTDMKKEIAVLEQKALKSRLEDFNPTFKVEELVFIICSLQYYEERYAGILKAKIDSLYSFYDKKLPGNNEKSDKKFSELVKHYSVINLKNPSTFNAFIDSAMGRLACALMKGELSLENEKEWMQNDAVNQIKKSYVPDYNWLIEGYLATPYNQGDDDERNAGDGVCERWSNRILAMLLENPKMASEKIPVQPELKDVLTESKLTLDDDQGQDVIVEKERKALGLSEPFDIPVRTNPRDVASGSRNYVTNFLFGGVSEDDAVLSKIAEHKGVFALDFAPSGDGFGHRIVVQFDRKNKIYRFFDANVGITKKYPSEEAFIKHFQKWLEISYDDLTEFEAIFFSSTK